MSSSSTTSSRLQQNIGPLDSQAKDSAAPPKAAPTTTVNQEGAEAVITSRLLRENISLPLQVNSSANASTSTLHKALRSHPTNPEEVDALIASRLQQNLGPLGRSGAAAGLTASSSVSSSSPSSKAKAGANSANSDANDADALITSTSPTHPANQIPALCRAFYTLGWVTGTGGGTSIRHGPHVFLAPSGVQKEKIVPQDIFVLDFEKREYLRKPTELKASQCTPLFLAAFDRGAGCCIHTHSQWAVLVTLLVERDLKERKESDVGEVEGGGEVFEIEEIEQIKGIPRGRGKTGMLGYFDRLRIPIIENTAHEEDLTESLEAAMDRYPDAYAVLVKRHGVYVWGDNVHKAKTQAESLDYIFQLAVRMRELKLAWTKDKPTFF